jgi:hypothetical protein
MEDDADRLRQVLASFARDPDNSSIWPAARELADRFTLDQLSAMAVPHAAEVRQLFDRVLGRTTQHTDIVSARPARRTGKPLSI